MLWSLLPIPVGMACLFFAWTIPFQEHEKPLDDEDNLNTDQALERYFAAETQNPDATPMPDTRKKYFLILFTGLGIGSILLGMETFYPVFNLIAKATFLLTILISVGVHLWDKQKEKSYKKKTAKDEI